MRGGIYVRYSVYFESEQRLHAVTVNPGYRVCVWFDLHDDSGGIPCGAMLSAPSLLLTC